MHLSGTGRARRYTSYEVEGWRISTSFEVTAWSGSEGTGRSGRVVGLQIHSFTPDEKSLSLLYPIAKQASGMGNRDEFEGLVATKYEDPLAGFQWLLQTLDLRDVEALEIAKLITIPRFGSPPQEWLSLATVLGQKAGASAPGLISAGLVAKAVPNASPALLLMTFLSATFGVHFITPTVKTAGEIVVEYLDLLRPSHREGKSEAPSETQAAQRSTRKSATASTTKKAREGATKQKSEKAAKSRTRTTKKVEPKGNAKRPRSTGLS